MYSGSSFGITSLTGGGGCIATALGLTFDLGLGFTSLSSVLLHL